MQQLFQQFNALNALIIGDVMLDSYLWGKVERISPEAPVPVVHIHKRENRLGGAANVALNIQALGANPVICSVIGTDKEGDDLLQVMKQQELTVEGIIRHDNRPTTVKTRVIGHNQQIVRIDSETDKNLDDHSADQLIRKIHELIDLKNIDVIIFEDYDKGVISAPLIRNIVDLARQKNIITVVDPKKRNFLDYHYVTLFKPNLKELREGLKVEVDPARQNELDETADLIHSQFGCSKVMVTLSELGVYISSEKGKKTIPAHIRNIADVSGAGDTVIATAALCLAAGFDDFTTAAIANLAGGLVCEYVGVVPIDKNQLIKETGNNFTVSQS